MNAATNAPTLSIIIASHERLAQLKQCVAVARSTVRSAHEIIVVGGAGSDATEAWAKQQSGIRFVKEMTRAGPVRALNMGLRQASGRFVLWLHDDARLLPDAADAAVRAIKRPDFVDVGLIAMFESNFTPAADRSQAHRVGGVDYAVGQCEGSVYSHFGLMRRESLVEMGLLDERFYAHGWEIDLALRLERDYRQRVAPLREARIAHGSDLGSASPRNLAMIERDMQRLSLKWGVSASDSPAPTPVAATVAASA